MKPRPPTWIISRITSCPKRLHWVQVSRSTRPVTQVADVAVNREVMIPAERPEREAAGRFSSRVPTRIIPRKENAMIRLMLTARRFFHCFRGRRVCFPVAIVFPSFRENSIHYTGPRNQAGLKSPAGMEYNIRDVI